MISAFGVDHGDVVSKAASKKKNGGPGTKASFGRHLTAQAFPGIHGAVAGKQGRKLGAFGVEAGTAIGGGAAGGTAGALIGRAVTKNPVGLAAGGLIGQQVGARTALGFGVKANQKKGRYAPRS